jgi:predicted  nucleic acid-binding Zn-ribbon protein
MSSLKENLAALSATLPDVPSELGELLEQSRRLQGRVTDFLNGLADKEARAEETLGRIDQALGALQQGSDAERSRLEGELAEFERHLDGNLTELENDQEDLTGRVEAAAAASDSLSEQLVEAGGSGRAAEEQASERLGDLQQAARDGSQEVLAAFDEAAREADALEDAAEEAREGLQRTLGDLAERMHRLAEQAGRRTEHMVQLVDGLQSEHEAAVTEQGSRLDEGHQAILQEMGACMARDLKEPLAVAAQGALDVMAELKAEGVAAAASCRAGGEQIDAALEGLRGAARPVPQAVAAVRRAADQVGLPWG